MKQVYPEANFACDPKRKGKEKAMDLSTTSETRWNNTLHGVGYCDGTCQPGPSCMLFPRRPDGKVVLPDPEEISRPIFKPEIYSGSARQVIVSPAVNRRQQPYQYPEPIAPSKASPSIEPNNDRPSSQSHKIESYAQLSSLPEFKAFRMDQDNGDGRNTRQSTRQRATNTTEESNATNKSSSSSPNATPNVEMEWQQWKMREIRVVKRRRKQEYIRSGTHDFSIRLWSNHEG